MFQQYARSRCVVFFPADFPSAHCHLPSAAPMHKPGKPSRRYIYKCKQTTWPQAVRIVSGQQDFRLRSGRLFVLFLPFCKFSTSNLKLKKTFNSPEKSFQKSLKQDLNFLRFSKIVRDWSYEPNLLSLSDPQETLFQRSNIRVQVLCIKTQKGLEKDHFWVLNNDIDYKIKGKFPFWA